MSALALQPNSERRLFGPPDGGLRGRLQVRRSLTRAVVLTVTAFNPHARQLVCRRRPPADVGWSAFGILPFVLFSLAYAVVRLLLEILVVQRRADARLRAEVLALRHKLRVLERQVCRPRWRPTDRLLLAAISRTLPGPAWRSLLPSSETLVRGHRCWSAVSGPPTPNDSPGVCRGLPPDRLSPLRRAMVRTSTTSVRVRSDGRRGG